MKKIIITTLIAILAVAVVFAVISGISSLGKGGEGNDAEERSAQSPDGGETEEVFSPDAGTDVVEDLPGIDLFFLRAVESMKGAVEHYGYESKDEESIFHIIGADVDGIKVLKHLRLRLWQRLARMAHGGAQRTKTADLVRQIPCIKTAQHIGTDEEVQPVLRELHVHRAQRFDRVALAAAPKLDVADRKTRVVEQDAAHFHARLSVR